MKNVLCKLEDERNTVIAQLKNGQREFLPVKLELDRAIACLQFCEQYGLFDRGETQPEALELPVGERGGWIRYRLMDDCETNDRNGWKERKSEARRRRPLYNASPLALNLRLCITAACASVGCD